MADPISYLRLLEEGEQIDYLLNSPDVTDEEKEELKYIWNSLKSRKESKFDAIVGVIKECDAIINKLEREEKEITPYYFTREDTNTIFFAGIFENDQFCLITEEAKENIKEIHHRQPVILNHVDVNRYLNFEMQGSPFLNERKIPDLKFHEISKDVNKPTNNISSSLGFLISDSPNPSFNIYS